MAKTVARASVLVSLFGADAVGVGCGSIRIFAVLFASPSSYAHCAAHGRSGFDFVRGFEGIPILVYTVKLASTFGQPKSLAMKAHQ